MLETDVNQFINFWMRHLEALAQLVMVSGHELAELRSTWITAHQYFEGTLGDIVVVD